MVCGGVDAPKLYVGRPEYDARPTCLIRLTPMRACAMLNLTGESSEPGHVTPDTLRGEQESVAKRLAERSKPCERW